MKANAKDIAVGQSKIVPRGDGNTDETLAKLRKLAMDPRASPLLYQDDAMLSKLPPTFIQACEFDPVRDEELLYVHRLRSLGVDVTLSFLRNAVHVEPIIVDILGELPSKASFKGFEDAVEFIKLHK